MEQHVQQVFITETIRPSQHDLCFFALRVIDQTATAFHNPGQISPPAWKFHREFAAGKFYIGEVSPHGSSLAGKFHRGIFHCW